MWAVIDERDDDIEINTDDIRLIGIIEIDSEEESEIGKDT